MNVSLLIRGTAWRMTSFLLYHLGDIPNADILAEEMFYILQTRKKGRFWVTSARAHTITHSDYWLGHTDCNDRLLHAILEVESDQKALLAVKEKKPRLMEQNISSKLSLNPPETILHTLLPRTLRLLASNR